MKQFKNGLRATFFTSLKEPKQYSGSPLTFKDYVYVNFENYAEVYKAVKDVPDLLNLFISATEDDRGAYDKLKQAGYNLGSKGFAHDSTIKIVSENLRLKRVCL